MKAKDFLNQLKKLDRLIENKLIEIQQWKVIASGTSAQLSGERVQSSGSQQKMADAVVKYIGIEQEIDRCVDSLIDKKQDVINVIEQLEAVEYDLLHKVYVQFIPLADVAVMYGKTYSWATTVHGRALKNVQEILDRREGVRNE